MAVEPGRRADRNRQANLVLA